MVDRLGELLRRHDGAQQRLNEWSSHFDYTTTDDYMRSTRQVLALAVRAVVSRVDLWLQGESSIADASTAHASILEHNLPFNLARTVALDEVRQMALDVDEMALHCIPVETLEPLWSRSSSSAGAQQ